MFPEFMFLIFNYPTESSRSELAEICSRTDHSSIVLAFEQPPVAVHSELGPLFLPDTKSTRIGAFSTTDPNLVVEKRTKSEFSQLLSKLSLIKGFGEDGGISEPPDENAKSLAGDILQILDEAMMLPENLAACVDGGVTMSLTRNEYLVVIECHNGGEIVIGWTSSKSEALVKEIDETEIPNLPSIINGIV
jgi:hypothetical protein